MAIGIYKRIKPAWNKGITGYKKINRKIYKWYNKKRPEKLCLYCNSQITGLPCHINIKKFCNRECYKKYNIGINHPLYGTPRNDEIKLKISMSKKGKTLTEEHKRKIRENNKYTMLGKTHTDKVKRFLSLNTIKQYSEGRIAKSMNTLPEKIMKNILNELNINFIHQYNFNNRFVCDFAIPEKKIIIECDGNYWHNYPYGTNKDKSKDAYISACGWKILRFWESDIYKNKDCCLNKIMEILK